MQALLNEKITLVFVLGALVIFAILPWVSLDSDVSGIYWSIEDARTGENADSLSGLDLVQADSFIGTQPTLLMIMVGALVLTVLSLVIAAFVEPFKVFDPYVRFVLGGVIVLLAVYVSFTLLTGEVGSQTTFSPSYISDDGTQIIIGIMPPDGKDYFVRGDAPENASSFVGSSFDFKTNDFMNIHIGPIAMLLAGLVIAVRGRVPTSQNIQRARLLFRMSKMTDDECIEEVRRIWEKTPEYSRRNTVLSLLGTFKGYDEINELLEKWSKETKNTA